MWISVGVFVLFMIVDLVTFLVLVVSESVFV